MKKVFDKTSKWFTSIIISLLGFIYNVISQTEQEVAISAIEEISSLLRNTVSGTIDIITNVVNDVITSVKTVLTNKKIGDKVAFTLISSAIIILVVNRM